MIISASLASIILAAILSSFLFLTRSGLIMRNYVDMETQARNAMETFALDVRMSSGVSWNTDQSVTLTIERDGSTAQATYAYYATASGSIPARSFVRLSGTEVNVLITDIKSFSYHAYSIDTAAVSLTSIGPATNRATKQIQISLETERAQSSLASATNKVISARFVLRNKSVTA